MTTDRPPAARVDPSSTLGTLQRSFDRRINRLESSRPPTGAFNNAVIYVETFTDLPAAEDGTLGFTTDTGQWWQGIGGSWLPFVGVPSNVVSAYMRFYGEWSSAQGVYPPGGTVTKDGWTMCCMNPAGCSTYPAPRPTGEPAWVHPADLTDAGSLVGTSQLYYGNRFNWGAGGYITNVAFWVDEADPQISYQPIISIDGGPLSYETEFSPTTTGWNVVPTITPTLLQDGTVLDVWIRKQDRRGPAPATFAHSWDYVRKNQAPVAGEAAHRNNGTTIRFHDLDDGGTDRSTDLARVAIGDDITADGQTWTVTSVQQNASDFEFDVTPGTGITEGVQLFTFTLHSETSVTVSYEYDIGGAFSGPNGSSQGIAATNTPDASNPTLDGNYYGVDIEVQDADVSYEWEPVATSASVGGGGSGDFLPRDGSLPMEADIDFPGSGTFGIAQPGGASVKMNGATQAVDITGIQQSLYPADPLVDQPTLSVYGWTGTALRRAGYFGQPSIDVSQHLRLYAEYGRLDLGTLSATHQVFLRSPVVGRLAMQNGVSVLSASNSNMHATWLNQMNADAGLTLTVADGQVGQIQDLGQFRRDNAWVYVIAVFDFNVTVAGVGTCVGKIQYRVNGGSWTGGNEQALFAPENTGRATVSVTDMIGLFDPDDTVELRLVASKTSPTGTAAAGPSHTNCRAIMFG